MPDSKTTTTDAASELKEGLDAPRVINPSVMKFGPDWLKWCFFTGWALFVVYLLFLALYKTDRSIDARQPFDERSMELGK
ncbi:MAG: hypothetical protein ABIH86_03190 [Planctomycetota bacterium]